MEGNIQYTNILLFKLKVEFESRNVQSNDNNWTEWQYQGP